MDIRAHQGNPLSSWSPDDADDADNDAGGALFPRQFSQGHDSCHGGLKNLMA